MLWFKSTCLLLSLLLSKDFLAQLDAFTTDACAMCTTSREILELRLIFATERAMETLVTRLMLPSHPILLMPCLDLIGKGLDAFVAHEHSLGASNQTFDLILALATERTGVDCGLVFVIHV